MKNKTHSVAIVVPVYGRGENLPELASRTDNTFKNANLDQPTIIFIDDCGSSDSWNTITELAKSRSKTKAILLSKNFGQHNALMCGFHEAREAVVVTIDDDLQQEPESIPVLVNQLLENDLDLVYGTYGNKKHALGRNLGSTAVNAFYRFIFKTPTSVTSFRAIRQHLVQNVLSHQSGFVYLDGLFAWNSNRIGGVEIPHHARSTGRSGYTISKLIGLALNVFTNFSILPLQIVSWLGVATFMVGTSLGCWFLFAAIFSFTTVPGFASIIVAVLILGGIQMLSLGAIGEYLGRIHINANGKPQFTIREKIEYQTRK
ncbi:glycosyltransferase family 2 protein [Rhodopirellula sp.]|nr:glycosyltransferase family 2 protein [Rhodopirellula sp.]